MLSGMMMQQSVFAAATVSVADGVVTITAVKAGDLMAYLQSASDADKSAIRNATTIVFKGKFNGQDIDALNGADCCTQSVVDMSEARFVKSSSSGGGSSYLLYHNNTPSTGQEGQHCIVGATKYASAQSNSYSLVEISENEGNGWQVMNVLPEERNTITLYSSGACYQLPTSLNYYKLIVEKDQYNNETSRTWQEITSPTAEEVASAIAAEGSKTVANLEELKSNYQGNDIIKIRSTDCTYQYFKSVSPLYWTEDNSNYDDGATTDTWYSRIEDAPDPTDNGQTVYADGTEYVYTNGQWELASEVSSGGGDEEYDYTQMKFDYWKNSVEEITTSKYAEGRLADQLCTDCSKLKTLTLSAGDFALAGTMLGNSINSLETVNILSDVTSLSDGMFNGKSSITTVTFEDGNKNLTVGEDCFNNCSGITSLVLPARLSSMGKQAFANTTGVASLSIPENSRLTTIPEQAFKSCGNNTQAEFDITIPRSVTLIEDEGFGDMWRLKIVRFTGQEGDAPLVIETGAFAGGTESNYTLSDVYVDIDPDDRKLICEYGAFSYTSMEGQTSVANIEALTTLHFTEDYWDYYAGNWKKGVTFDQAALNSFKDGCDPTKTPMNANYMIGTNDQIHNNNGHIPGKQPANGWQQFAKTSTGIIILPEGKFYRTYSTPTVLVKPDWMKIYRVKSFDDGYTEGDDVNSSAAAAAVEKKANTEELNFKVTVDNKDVYCIPANTGVIRVDIRDEEAIYYLLEWSDLSQAYKDGYNNNAASWEFPYEESVENNNARTNYLFPTLGEEVTIGPVEKEGNEIKYRIFGLKRVTESGVVPQFLRSKKNVVMGDHRAFLKLPASVFHWKNEKEGSSQDATGNDVVVDENNTYAKISLFFDEDIEDVNGGVSTEIINAIEEDMYKNDSFYTLQGVKVAKPTSKGVYIHNGKKIYIK